MTTGGASEAAMVCLEWSRGEEEAPHWHTQAMPSGLHAMPLWWTEIWIGKRGGVGEEGIGEEWATEDGAARGLGSELRYLELIVLL